MVFCRTVCLLPVTEKTLNIKPGLAEVILNKQHGDEVFVDFSSNCYGTC